MRTPEGLLKFGIHQCGYYTAVAIVVGICTAEGTVIKGTKYDVRIGR